MSLEDQIRSVQREPVERLRDLLDELQDDKQLVRTLLKLLKDDEIQPIASWLLKAWLERGYQLSKSQVKQIYRRLNQLERWESQLHLLQSLPMLPADAEDSRRLWDFLEQTCASSNKFVRAWTYQGYYEIATRFPETLDQVRVVFEQVGEDEPAAVKARVRNLRKTGFLDEE